MAIMINDDLRISSDLYQFIVEERIITKTGVNAGKEVWNSVSFHPNITSLLESLLKKRLLTIPKKKDMNLDEFLESLHKEIKKFDKTIRECAIANSKVLPTIEKTKK